MGKNELKKPGADHQRTLPFRPIPEYKPFAMPESARPMSFCEFQRQKFETLFSPSGAIRYRRHQERDHPEFYR